jgi:uncharacterized protein with NAD-binding domain and iron-sulfur cluster
MNNVDGWAFRPESRTEVPNLYLAGDYCRSHVDLISMEGAVTTGLLAAEALRQDAAFGAPIEVLRPAELPAWLIMQTRISLLPLAIFAKLVAC